MNQYEWKRQGRRLMESQEKFVNTVHMIMDIFIKFSEAQQAFHVSLDSRDDAFRAAREAARLQDDLVDKLLESNAALQNAYQATQNTINDNNARMEKMLAKMETYFGTTGLDYDN